MENNLILFIDEGELYLHADWQKKFLNSLLSGMQEIFKERKIQIILTSHTPFLLSDLPKENVIFLNKDDNGKCIVVNGLKEKKQTFGANIHTLFSDSFFLEGGLIGEFAKGKINWVIEKLQTINKTGDLSNEENKLIQYIINTIGEPIIKNKILQLYRQKQTFEVDTFSERLLKIEKELGSKNDKNKKSKS